MSGAMKNEVDISIKMAGILGSMVAMLGGLVLLQTKSKTTVSMTERMLPDPKTQPSKRAYELYTCCYTPFWIGAFAVIVAFQLYEDFTAQSYLVVCGGLALPFLLQPLLFPSCGFASPDAKRPLFERYAFKANLWIAVYSFIGNYWYTHYFYSVLKAEYTMPSHRLNNVPIAMFLATHFYFSTYHFFSNCLLRYITVSYQATLWRHVLFVSTVLVFSYFTAFMETLTISSYPYYSFQDRDMAYTVGSAFYGIYFIVSFPAFFCFDNDIDGVSGGKTGRSRKIITLWDTFISSCGHGMIILTLLDFVRLQLDIPLVVGAPPIA